MSRRMPGTGSRRDSAAIQFNRRLPSDLAGKVAGHPVVLTFPALGTAPAKVVSTRLSASHVRFSLGTTDRSTADQRAGLAIAHLEALYAELRRGQTTLSHKQTVALAGEVYALVVTKFDENPGSPEHWAAFKVLNRQAREGCEPAPRITPEMTEEDDSPGLGLEARFGLLTDWVLATKALNIDDASRAALLREVDTAATDAAWRMKRAARGDYSPDPKAARFPAWSPPAPSAERVREAHAAAAAIGPSWDTLIATWERTHEASGGASPTRREWRSRIMSFANWADVEPAAVTDKHVRDWRDKRLAVVTARTVGLGDLMMLRTVYGTAIREQVFKGTNPAQDVRVTNIDRTARPMRGFTNDEAARILNAARCERAAYRRWVPWLCAFTGSRVSPVINLRPQDVKIIDGVVCIEISREAGPTKTRTSQRLIPLHKSILADGFIAFVESRKKAPRLFYDEHRVRSANAHNPGKGKLNSLRRWLHSIDGLVLGREANIDPNHAWRHWLKTQLRDAGVPDTVSDGITGHAPRTEGGGYGHVSLKAKADALAKIEAPTLAPKASMLAAE